MIEINHDLRDMIISALRYAIGSRTYITLSTCEFIMEHPELIDERVKNVMLRDLEKIEVFYNPSDIDYVPFKVLDSWLRNLEVK